MNGHYLGANLVPAESRLEGEGWALFDCDGRYSLQKDDEAAKFKSDADAIIYVAVRAANGSLRHREAIDKIGSRVPQHPIPAVPAFEFKRADDTEGGTCD